MDEGAMNSLLRLRPTLTTLLFTSNVSHTALTPSITPAIKPPIPSGLSLVYIATGDSNDSVTTDVVTASETQLSLHSLASPSPVLTEFTNASSSTTNSPQILTSTTTLPAAITTTQILQPELSLISTTTPVLISAISGDKPTTSDGFGHTIIVPTSPNQGSTEDSSFIRVRTTTMTSVFSMSTPLDSMSTTATILSDTTVGVMSTYRNGTAMNTSTNRESAAQTVVSSTPYASISTKAQFSHGNTTSTTLVVPDPSTTTPYSVPNASHIPDGVNYSAAAGTGVLSRVSELLTLTSSITAVSSTVPTIPCESGSVASNSSTLFHMGTPSSMANIDAVFFSLLGSTSTATSQTSLSALAIVNPTEKPPPLIITSTPVVTQTLHGDGPHRIDPTSTHLMPDIPMGQASSTLSSLTTTTSLNTPPIQSVLPTNVLSTSSSASVRISRSSLTTQLSSLASTTATTTTPGSNLATGLGVSISTEPSRLGMALEPQNTISPQFSSPSAETTAVASSSTLTATQKTGVAVGGTLAVVFAAVVIIFVARRYLTKRANRKLLPKETYLYDSKGGQGSKGRGDFDAEALTYGRPRGQPSRGHSTRFMFDHGQRPGTGSTSLAQNPGNLFKNHQYPHQDDPSLPMANSLHDSNYATTTHSTANVGYAVTSQRSHPMNRYPSGRSQLFRPAPTFSPTFSPRHSYARALSRNSIQSYNAQHKNATHALVSPAALQYPTLSPYGRSSLTMVQEPRHGDHDPFEHDLIMHVDARSEGSDFVTVITSPTLARAPSTRTPVGPRLPVRARARTSPTSTKGPLYRPTLQPRLSSGQSLESNTSSSTGRFSLAYDNNTSATYLAPSNKKGKPSPLAMPPLTPAHKGFGEIKRFSLAYDTNTSTTYLSPIPRNDPSLSAPKRSPLNLAPPPMERNSPQQQGLAISNAGPLLPSSHYEEPLSFDLPNARGMRGDSPTLTSSVYSTDSAIHNARRAETEFADPGLIGRSF